jgi:hypothetical protein
VEGEHNRHTQSVIGKMRVSETNSGQKKLFSDSIGVAFYLLA